MYWNGKEKEFGTTRHRKPPPTKTGVQPWIPTLDSGISVPRESPEWMGQGGMADAERLGGRLEKLKRRMKAYKARTKEDANNKEAERKWKKIHRKIKKLKVRTAVQFWTEAIILIVLPNRTS